MNLSGDLQHVDFLSISGHKLHGPKGAGALYIRRGAAWRPWMLGGHQENGRRAGTENVPGIIGLGAACALAARSLPDEVRVAALRDRLERELCARIPWMTVNGAGADRRFRRARHPRACQGRGIGSARRVFSASVSATAVALGRAARRHELRGVA